MLNCIGGMFGTSVFPLLLGLSTGCHKSSSRSCGSIVIDVKSQHFFLWLKVAIGSGGLDAGGGPWH